MFSSPGPLVNISCHFACLQRAFENQEYSSDLQQVQELLRQHGKTHQDIRTFRSQIDKCIADMVSVVLYA
jgi:hypothetical protein